MIVQVDERLVLLGERAARLGVEPLAWSTVMEQVDERRLLHGDDWLDRYLAGPNACEGGDPRRSSDEASGIVPAPETTSVLSFDPALALRILKAAAKLGLKADLGARGWDLATQVLEAAAAGGVIDAAGEEMVLLVVEEALSMLVDSGIPFVGTLVIKPGVRLLVQRERSRRTAEETLAQHLVAVSAVRGRAELLV